MQTIFEQASASYAYPEFIQLLESLLAEGKTTGTNQSEEYLHFAKLNLQRMRRWDKTFVLNPELQSVLAQMAPQQWWVITEGWCGDSAQNLPGIVQMAEAAKGNISLRIILRDENPAIMDQYLTNGSRSIPIVVVFDQKGKELFHWGPRPADAQKLLVQWQSETPQRSFEAFEQEMHTWYAKDKAQQLQEEWRQLLLPYSPK